LSAASFKAILKILSAGGEEAMDLLSGLAQREERPETPRRQTLRKNSIDRWPLAILLERGAYLRKLAAVGDGTACETLREYSQHSTLLCFRSRSGDAEMHENFACMFHVLDGRATLVTCRVMAGAEQTGPGETQGAPLEGDTRYELRAGDVVHIPAGQFHQVLVSGEKSITYLAVRIQEGP
jgi:mannose-6-phosphate isomerase-like protein (cupin superfamily)